jgi:hypothetical protein
MANPTRTTSVATGTLLILATVAAVAAAALVPTGTETLLLAAPGQPHRLALAAIFYLLAAAGSASIPIALYPLLQKIDAPFALASVVFRSIEAVFYTVAVVSLLSIPPLTTQPDSGGAPAQAIAGSLISLRDHANLAAIFAFCLGAWSYYYVLYRARVVPRWLSAWGVAGVLLMLAAAVFALFSNAPVTGYTVLILPIAVQEITLAVWLLIRGFDLRPHPVLARSESSSMPTTHPLDEHRIAQAP